MRRPTGPKIRDSSASASPCSRSRPSRAACVFLLPMEPT